MESSLRQEEDIFSAALDIVDPAARANFLERSCKGDAELRARVEASLAASTAAEEFFAHTSKGLVASREVLSRNSALDPVETEATGTCIGPYKLLQHFGEGGCGAVYMAEQETPVRRRVALKIIKLGMDTRSVIARFEAERQALAMMDHPNIARVLDAGATDKGRPFFVMELVRGVKITEYCDQAELDARQRLELFVEICHAIQHAHQKGIIHRDIKPSNILVTTIDGRPVPKVIDFGIAKAIEGRLTDKTIFTAYEQFIGTPAYMSPEQAVMSGVDVDTRSDIYSLGVLLYELLAGRPPFESKELLEQGIDGLRRTLQEREPQRPSVIVTTLQGSALEQVARSRNAEPPKLISMLQGELDWIVIRALEKDRSRRYQTANELALDVGRFLKNEPVGARPPSRLYRFQKLVRRNKVTFAAGTAVALSLIAGLGVSTWFWRQERATRVRAVLAEQQAHVAEREQARLRIEAEDRERIAMAAYALSEKKFKEADELARTVLVLKPSLEAEKVLRDLGRWHVEKGDWAAAAERFKLLLQVDQRDTPWMVTDDLLMAGPILIELGDREGYEQFRKAAIAQFSKTEDPVFAERTLKISLLLPAGEAVMKSLQPLAEVATRSMQGNPDYNNSMVAWRCTSLALMAYRQEQGAMAIKWCEGCLSNAENNPSRIAMAHVLKAMALCQLRQIEAAQTDLAQGRQLMEKAMGNGLKPKDWAAGLWYDWLFVRILLREATELNGRH